MSIQSLHTDGAVTVQWWDARSNNGGRRSKRVARTALRSWASGQLSKDEAESFQDAFMMSSTVEVRERQRRRRRVRKVGNGSV